VAQLRLTRADCQRARFRNTQRQRLSSAFDHAEGQHGLWAVRQCQFMAQMRSAELIGQRPSSGAKRKICAHSEFFGF
jgi:hypothetical protein